MQTVCRTNGVVFQTNQTRFAAALCTLGYELEEKRITNGAIVSFEFDTGDQPGELKAMDYGWRNFEAWRESKPTHPLTYMHKVSDARDWIVHQVVNGHHNESLILPADTYSTNILEEACCLVANDFYLIKLEKMTRLFHFPVDARARSGVSYNWQMKYLESFYWLMRCIRQGKLTRQPKN